MVGEDRKPHIHLDIVGGIAGDMFIASVLDMFEHLQAEVLCAVKLVLPAQVGSANLSRGLNKGISGLQFNLKLSSINASENDSISSHCANVGDKNTSAVVSHKHSHTHVEVPSENHTKSEAHKHAHATLDKHEHSQDSSYKNLCQLILKSTLDASVINIAIELLTIIGKAEAKIHAQSLDDVCFHELADWDSVMDVVASAVILNALSKYSWSISKLPIGGGLVQTQHGLIPVPAPATAEILKGFDFVDDGIQGERITPTGAAILHYLQKNKLLIHRPEGLLVATGYGLGTKSLLNMPNILRAVSFESSNNAQEQAGAVVIVEFDIDDMTGEELALSLDLLRAQCGVIDVVAYTGRGKKNRAVEIVRILVSSQHYQTLIDACFLQTSTLGVRYRFESRHYLQRDTISSEEDTQNKYAYKLAVRPDGEVTVKAEHDQLVNGATLKSRRAVKANIEMPACKGKAL